MNYNQKKKSGPKSSRPFSVAYRNNLPKNFFFFPDKFLTTLRQRVGSQRNDLWGTKGGVIFLQFRVFLPTSINQAHTQVSGVRDACCSLALASFSFVYQDLYDAVKALDLNIPQNSPFASSIPRMSYFPSPHPCCLCRIS